LRGIACIWGGVFRGGESDQDAALVELKSRGTDDGDAGAGEVQCGKGALEDWRVVSVAGGGRGEDIGSGRGGKGEGASGWEGDGGIDEGEGGGHDR